MSRLPIHKVPSVMVHASNYPRKNLCASKEKLASANWTKEAVIAFRRAQLGRLPFALWEGSKTTPSTPRKTT